MADNNDRAVFIDGVGLSGLSRRITRRDDFVIENEESRGQQHGQGNDEQQLVGDGGGNDLVGNGKGQQHKTKLAGLRQTEGQQPAVSTAKSEHKGQRQKDGALQQHQADGHRDNRAEICEQQTEIDPRTDGDEKQAKQQTLEGIDVTFQFVAVFAVGQNNPGEKRAKSGRKTDQCHQQRNADHHHQRGGSKQFAQFGHGDKAEHRPCQK